jgi:hypothetical protein
MDWDNTLKHKQGSEILAFGPWMPKDPTPRLSNGFYKHFDGLE